MIYYDEPVFRPPSEANSLILQVTIGCSWNKCSFCEMYTSKTFRTKKIEEIIADIENSYKYFDDINKVFLADGNAFCLNTSKLLKIIEAVKDKFPKVRRISSYALPSDILRKSETELKELFNAGLNLLYIGIETGDDKLLRLINKCETYKTTVEGLTKAQNAGIKNSVMIINGLGGRKYSKQHSLNSSKIINDIQPAYLSTLVLSFPFAIEHFRQRINYEFEELNMIELFSELYDFIEKLELKDTIFRTDHASNYLPLKGILSRDKNKLLNILDLAIKDPSTLPLRPEWMRGL